MSPTAPSQTGSDVVLAEAIEEFTNRLQAGEPIDVESYVQKHPEHAERLRKLLPALALLDDLGRSVSAVAGGSLAASRDGSLAGTLGDFRILREVGKGGMGVVYEAEQISLRRRVALKVLPFAATMDPRHLQRFHNEAQAAASLHHTNIVPVHFVGCERGVHFYGMQFIDGQPLSEIIRQLRQKEKKTPTAAVMEQTAAYQPPAGAIATSPTVRQVADVTPLSSEGRRGREYYRKVAELGVQAAEALDHAHQAGIVHRDIKPANLLLDARGNVWVTDFGLAHMQHGDASLTMTGQAVGTPRYMSPEQALAKRVPIDHRTDVYSLGVTLYELLALRPAFASEDRHELLRQIAFEEPAKPRRLERAIPAELETVVLTAMEKRPQDRYATAQELADDLRHWLDDRPIRARRPSWIQVARKWMRRHQSVMWTAALFLFVLMIVGIANTLWWMQQQTEAAKKQIAAETEARAASDEAVRWQQEEKWSDALGAVRRAQAVLRGLGSNEDLRQQVDELGKDLEMAQRLEEARFEMIEGNIDFEACSAAYGAVFQEYGMDAEHLDATAAGERMRSRSIRMQLASALDHWASLKRRREDQQWTHLVAVAQAVDPDPWRNRLRDAWVRRDGKAVDALAVSADVANLPPATLLLLLGLPSQEAGSGERVVDLIQRAQQHHPDDFWLNYTLASLLRGIQPPRWEEAIRHGMIAVALRPKSPVTHVNLGIVLRDSGRLNEAIAEYRQAIHLKKDDSQAHHNLAIAQMDKGQLDEAIAEYRELIRLKKDDAPAHGNLGLALTSKGRLDEGIAEIREAIRLEKDNAMPHINLGVTLMRKGRLDEAVDELREALRLNEALRIRNGYTEATHYNLGLALAKRGNLDEAINDYHLALRLMTDRALAHTNLGDALLKKGQLDEAIAEYREAIRLWRNHVHSSINHSFHANAHLVLGAILFDKKHDYDNAIAEFQEALRLKKDHDFAHYMLASALWRKSLSG